MIKVITAGFYTTIQDLGRIGFADIGVPVSGAMDLYAAQLANQLLSNEKQAAVLEITFGNCVLEFQVAQFICISGADFSPELNKDAIPLNTSIKVNAGDVLSFGKRIYGVRSYIAVNGGFKTEKVLASRSFYKGITKSALIKNGMFLPVELISKLSQTSSIVKVNEPYFNSDLLACYKGPEYDLLSKKQQTELENTKFTISKDNSRMGYKLEEVIVNDLKSMLTSAVLPGTVQLTPSGKLIILMRDCQVTGGYPRVLQLSEMAMNQLAQKTTGSQFRFELKSY